jgi:hypothetical protein
MIALAGRRACTCCVRPDTKLMTRDASRLLAEKEGSSFLEVTDKISAMYGLTVSTVGELGTVWQDVQSRSIRRA